MVNSAAPDGRGATGLNLRDGIASPSRVDTAVELLTRLSQAAEPGAHLGTKEDLRLRCGVSVGTFNEALRLLQSRGLVAVRPGPGGGLFATEQPTMIRFGDHVLVLDADETSVADAAQIRNALDPLLVADALWHASPADIAALEQELAKMSRAAQEENGTEFIRANWRLHARIATISPNAMLRSIYLGLLDLIESHMISAQPVPGVALPRYLHKRYVLHRALVDAISARDRQAALDLIAKHNTTSPPDLQTASGA